MHAHAVAHVRCVSVCVVNEYEFVRDREHMCEHTLSVLMCLTLDWPTGVSGEGEGFSLLPRRSRVRSRVRNDAEWRRPQTRCLGGRALCVFVS